MARRCTTEVLQWVGVELAWLVGSYALAFWGVKLLLGYSAHEVNTLDIQMHNTYFVLSVPVLAPPLFLAIASVTTAVRLASGRFRTPYTTAALIGLAGLWLLVLLAVGWLAGTVRLAHGR